VPPDAADTAAGIYPNAGYAAAVTTALSAPLPPNDKRRTRQAIARFLRDSENNRAAITYTQARPFVVYVNPAAGYRGDCSSYVTQAFAWAKKQTGLPLHDPNGRVEYDGYGWTGTLLATNHQHSIRPVSDRHFFIGDLAIYGTFYNTVHVTVCRQGGDLHTAVWSSHGSQAGPMPVSLFYRGDLLGVYRPVSLL
jgi:hypothetical protein